MLRFFGAILMKFCRKKEKNAGKAKEERGKRKMFCRNCTELNWSGNGKLCRDLEKKCQKFPEFMRNFILHFTFSIHSLDAGAERWEPLENAAEDEELARVQASCKSLEEKLAKARGVHFGKLLYSFC